ncbi:hypothetical protein [Marinobacter sp. X15-166B]|uniref:hypothetical protein n=1 Tax=Marinobacter sp. X15-166B TaxID=1897620 RepID=UPI00085C2730|nr:hypothetical protein [Marinobacter sp. X15-166B]OEY66799.1 hypothetical protein BG841_10260 [Marinobacter sp. X15-166B]
MAGGNDERVNLLISAAVDGLKSVEGLISDLQELEKSGRVELPDNSAALRDGLGKTSEEMQGLAERLTDLREQQGLVTQFAELKRETKELADQQQAARARATELGKALSETEAPTRAQTLEFERAKKAAAATSSAWVENNRNLNDLRGALEGAGISTKDLASEQVRINKEIEGVNGQASEMAAELRNVKQSAEDVSRGTDQAADSTEKLGKESEKSAGLLGKLGSGLKVVATAAAGIVAGVGASAATLTIFSKSQAAVADELTNTKNEIDVNREALQAWQIAGDRVGISGNGVAKMLGSVTERLGRLSATGSGRAAQVFDALNMDIEEFSRLAPDQQMIKLAAAVETLPKGDQVGLLKTLGADAAKMQPLLENNAAGLRAIAEEASQAGAIYSEKELDRLNKANDVYNAINTKILGLTRRIGAELAPAVGEATNRVMELFDQSGSGDKLIQMFSDLVKWGEDLATSLLSNTESISAGFTGVWNTVKSVSSGVMAVFNGLRTVVATFVTFLSVSFSNLMSAAQGLTWALNQIGVVSNEAYNNIKAKAEAARATTAALAEETVEYGRKTLEAGKGVVTAFIPAEQQLKKVEEQARKSGDAILGLAEDAKEAGKETEIATNNAEALANAYKDLGVTSQAQLEETTRKAKAAFEQITQSGTATQREIKEAFQAYATSVINSGDSAAVKALEVTAANLSLRDALLEVKGQAEEAGDMLSDKADKAADSTRRLAEETQRLAEEVDELKDAEEEAAEEAQKFREALGNAFGKALSAARESVTQLSAAARNLFEEKIGSNAFVDESVSATEALEQARQRTEELAAARRNLMNSSLASWFADTALAASQVKKEFYEQAVAMEQLAGRVNDGSYSLDQLNRIAATAANKFNLLDSQRLAGLQGAIDQARSKMESLNASAESTLSSLEQRLADIQGDTERAQQIQYEAERGRLQKELEAARQAGADAAAADYYKALQQLEKINEIEQRNRREAENEREKAAADRARQQQQAERERQQFERQRSTTTNNQNSQASAPRQTIVLQAPGGRQTEVLTDDEQGLLTILEQAGLRSI